MKISIGCDHRGYELKKFIIETYTDWSDTDQDIEWIDQGCNGTERCDYPVYAKKVVDSILSKESEFGILICGSGIGMAIAANRFKKIYAGLCCSPKMVKSAVEDDNLNVLVLSANFITKEQVSLIINSAIQAWSENSFKGGRYQDRLDMMDK